MKVTLSDDRVRRQPGKVGEKLDLWDAKHPGLHVRVTKSPSGMVTKVWRFLYTHEGRRKVWSWGEWPALDVETAQHRAEQARLEVKAGRDPRADEERRIQEEKRQRVAAAAEAQQRTLIALAAAHVRHLRGEGLTRTSIREEIRQFRREVFPVIDADKPAAEVTHVDIARVVKRIAGRGSKVMADRVRSTLVAVYKWGLGDAEWQHVLGGNPAVPVKRATTRKQRKPRDRVLTDDEVEALWLAAEPADDGKADLPNGVLNSVIAAAFRLRILTGQRWSEITKSRWADVRTEVIGGGGSFTRTWTIPRENTKSRERTHVVPLSPQAVAVLESIRERTEPTGWVFPGLRGSGHLGTVNRSFRAWKKRAKVEDFIGKDVRRTVITGMSKLGVPQEVRQAIANHSPRGVTKRVYDKYDLLPEKREALELWARHVERLVTGEADEPGHADMEMATGSFFTFWNDPGLVGVSIAYRQPRGMEYPRYAKLAPTPDMLRLPIEEYVQRFEAILEKLDPQAVWEELRALAREHGSETPVLLCWEKLRKPEDWCHRQMVATWFERELGVKVPEYSREERQLGLPKMGEVIPFGGRGA